MTHRRGKFILDAVRLCYRLLRPKKGLFEAFSHTQVADDYRLPPSPGAADSFTANGDWTRGPIPALKSCLRRSLRPRLDGLPSPETTLRCRPVKKRFLY